MYFSTKNNKHISIYINTKSPYMVQLFDLSPSPQGPLWDREPALGAPKDADLRRRLAQLFEESGGGAIAAAWVSVCFIGTHYYCEF